MTNISNVNTGLVGIEFSILVSEITIFLLFNFVVLTIYLLNKFSFSNSYYFTMKFVYISNLLLLLVIFSYVIDIDLSGSSLIQGLEEFGYAQIVLLNLVNCLNRFVAIVFYRKYNIWMTFRRTLILLIFVSVYNSVLTGLLVKFDFDFYPTYDYCRTGSIVITTNVLYLVAFVISAKRVKTMTGNSRKVSVKVGTSLTA